MTISFRTTETVEIQSFIFNREKEIEFFLNALIQLDVLKQNAISILRRISFNHVDPDFEKSLTSIRAYIGVYTEEIANAKKELAEREKSCIK